MKPKVESDYYDVLTTTLYTTLISYASSKLGEPLPDSVRHWVQTISDSLNLEVKTGISYHFNDQQWLQSVWIEALKRDRFSLDIGLSAKHYLAGMGYSITSNVDLEVGASLEKQTKKTGLYIGLSAKM